MSAKRYSEEFKIEAVKRTCEERYGATDVASCGAHPLTVRVDGKSIQGIMDERFILQLG